MDVAAYLRRIHYRGSLEPTLDTLRALHLAHLYSVPFENLDIHLGRPIVLDTERFFDKIVGQRRGGFCYELNGLFSELLRALGFRVTLLSARVPHEEGLPVPEFDHLTLRVDMPQAWLADVGAGDCFLEPMPLEEGAEQRLGESLYRLSGEGERWMVLKRNNQFEWKLVYDFTLTAHELSEFAGMCQYHQTSPQSAFTRRRICSMATPKGRVTVANMRLIITEDEVRRERDLAGQKECQAALRKFFGVDLGPGLVRWVREPAPMKESKASMEPVKWWKK